MIFKPVTTGFFDFNMKKIKISSKNNLKFKAWTKLSNKKYREKERKMLIEGETLLEEAIRSGFKIFEVILRSGYESKSQSIDNFPVFEIKEGMFNRLTSTVTPAGLLAVSALPRTDERTFFKRINAESTIPKNNEFSNSIGSNEATDIALNLEGKRKDIVVLNALQDPGNVGTIIRTAEAAGFAGVCYTDGTADIFSQKVVRSTAGSIFRMPIWETGSDSETLEKLHNRGYAIVASSPVGCDVFTNSKTESPVALIVGNEANGVSEEFLKKADSVVRIPMAGSIESMNVAVATGIMMYEIAKKHK